MEYQCFHPEKDLRPYGCKIVVDKNDECIQHCTVHKTSHTCTLKCSVVDRREYMSRCSISGLVVQLQTSQYISGFKDVGGETGRCDYQRAHNILTEKDEKIVQRKIARFQENESSGKRRKKHYDEDKGEHDNDFHIIKSTPRERAVAELKQKKTEEFNESIQRICDEFENVMLFIKVSPHLANLKTIYWEIFGSTQSKCNSDGIPSEAEFPEQILQPIIQDPGLQIRERFYTFVQSYRHAITTSPKNDDILHVLSIHCFFFACFKKRERGG